MAVLDKTKNQFDAKMFNPNAFGKYVERVPDLVTNEFLKAGILKGDEAVRNVFTSQTGSYHATFPMFGLIGGDAQNYDGESNITAHSTKTFKQEMGTYGRLNAWTEKDFSSEITAGVDFMSNVGNQVAKYWDNVLQKLILTELEGVFGMTGGKNAEFVKNHTYDITGKGTTEDPGICKADSLNNAIQQACGANKGIFKVAIMHSTVATNLENKQLLEFMTYNDANGIQRKLDIATWNGRIVFIDDDVPTTKISKVGTGPDDPTYVAAGTGYVTYLFGEGAFVYEDLPVEHPYEMVRDAMTNQGMTTLISRKRGVLCPRGISYLGTTQVSASPTDAELKTKTNWSLIDDGNGETIDPKSIAIARIISRG